MSAKRDGVPAGWEEVPDRSGLRLASLWKELFIASERSPESGVFRSQLSIFQVLRAAAAKLVRSRPNDYAEGCGAARNAGAGG